MDQNPFNIFSPDPPLENYAMNQQYNPNTAYFNSSPQQLNIQPQYGYSTTSYYQPIYNNPYGPQLNNTIYQQQRQPWQLIQPTPSSSFNGFMNPPEQFGSPFYSPNYGYANSYYQQQQAPKSYVIPGFNPTGNTEMYSEDMRNRLKALEDKYKKLNNEKMAERRNMYNSYGYNYYGMMNMNYVDPIIQSQYNREKAAIEAEAKEALMDFNMRLSRAAHYYLGDLDLDDEETYANVRKIYENQVVNIDQERYNEYVFQRSLERGRDITEEAKKSIQAADRKVSEYFHNIVSPDADLDEFLQKGGLILWQLDVDKMNAKGATYNERYSYDKLRKELDRNISIRDGFYPSYNDLDPSAPFREMARSGMLDPSPGVSMDFDTGTISLDRSSWEANKAQIQKNREQMNYDQQRKAFIESVLNPVV